MDAGPAVDEDGSRWPERCAERAHLAAALAADARGEDRDEMTVEEFQELLERRRREIGITQDLSFCDLSDEDARELLYEELEEKAADRGIGIWA